MTDLLFIRLTNGCVIQKCSPLLIRTEGVIDREHDAVDPTTCMASKSGGSVKKPLVVIWKLCKKYSGTAAAPVLPWV